MNDKSRAPVTALDSGIPWNPSCTHSAYVASLLCIDPYEVFPEGPEWGDNADWYFLDWIIERLDQLNAIAQQSLDYSPLALAYRRTLAHCTAVIEGEADPADNGWFDNRSGYRRGIYPLRGGKT